MVRVSFFAAGGCRFWLSANSVTGVVQRFLNSSDLASQSESIMNEPKWINPRASAQAVRAAEARKTSGRRRFVDPTTCEHDYSAAEIEFMTAIQLYKKKSGRMFPTWCEVLEVLASLGYEKTGLGEEADAAEPPSAEEQAPASHAMGSPIRANRS
jgi:hypothetical protein